MSTKLLTIAILATLTCPAMAAKKQPYKKTTVSERTVVIDSVIRAPEILGKANQLYKLAKESKAPINILVNSPGGEVFSAMQFINAMEAVKSEGVILNCYIPGAAFSMAFQIILHCDTRFAFQYSLFLWHPPRVNQSHVTHTPQSAAYLAWALREIEKRMLTKISSSLSLSRARLLYHHRNETIWTTEGLAAINPGFATVVKTMPSSLEALWHVDRMRMRRGLKQNPSPAPDCNSCHKKEIKHNAPYDTWKELHKWR